MHNKGHRCLTQVLAKPPTAIEAACIWRRTTVTRANVRQVSCPPDEGEAIEKCLGDCE
jgi:hypothetical protein